MAIIQMFSLSVPSPKQSLSSLKLVSGCPAQLFLSTKLSNLSFSTINPPSRTTPIRMGGGPRTFPGGVSKWQWKRMQAKKSKQLLKARLARERQIYEMRKRAELKAAVSELERPWEVVEKAPTLFSVGADEQLKVLADRFQKPGGFDMWSDKDGPELFKRDDGLQSARFFPKGVVHSVKPYGKIERIGDGSDGFDKSGSQPGSRSGSGMTSSTERENDLAKWRSAMKGERNAINLGAKNSNEDSGQKSLKNDRFKKGRNRREYSSDSEAIISRDVSSEKFNHRRTRRPVNSEKDYRRRNGLNNVKDSSNREVYDLRLRKDGSYEFQPEN